MPEPSHPVGAAPPTAGALRQRVILVVAAGIALALAFAVWHRPQAPPPSGVEPPATAPGASPATTRGRYVTVHVSGAVSHPGLVSLPEGNRVADALAAAGGVRTGGELRNINLAARLTDAMHIAVPWIGEDLSTGTGEPADRSPDFPVDVNSAGADRLTELPGVGHVLATRILAHRETHGPFAVLEDLLDVPGIGEGKLAGLRDHAVVRR